MNSDPLISDDVKTQPLRRVSGRRTMPAADVAAEGALPSRPSAGAWAETTPVPVTGSLTDPGRPTALRAPAATPETAVACPRCGGRLVNPDGLKFCSSCHYCGSIEQGLASLRPSHSSLGVIEVFRLVWGLPSWAWVTIGGMVAVALCSAAVGHLLPAHSYPRALWGTSLFLGGGLFAFLMQCWLLLELAPYDAQLSHADLLPSTRLWGMAFRCMPETCWPVWLAAWGLTASVCAPVFIGGLTYWFGPAFRL